MAGNVYRGFVELQCVDACAAVIFNSWFECCRITMIDMVIKYENSCRYGKNLRKDGYFRCKR